MITSSKIKNIQDKIKLAIKKIADEEKVSIEFGTVRFTAAYYATTMTVKTKEKSESIDKAFKAVCSRLGFTQNIMGMQFEGTNGIYEIVDIQTKNRKYPIIAKSISTGVNYKFTCAHIKKLIGGDKIINRNANLDKLLG